MLRHFWAFICLLFCLTPAFSQVSVARWQVNHTQLFVGQALTIKLKLFLSEVPEGVVVPEDEISRKIQDHFTSMGFLITLENQVESFSIEKKGNVISAMLWRGVIFHPDSGSFLFGKGLELSLQSGKDSSSLNRSIPVRIVPAAVKINNLPESVYPRAWSIGKFDVTYELNKNRYLTGEPIQLKITYSGQGSLATIPPPQLPVSDKFLVYDPLPRLDIGLENDQLVGEKTFEYELAGAYKGDFHIGPVSLYYFDLDTYRFDSVSIQDIPLQITGKDIPRLVEVNALDNFYRSALENPSIEQKLPFKYASGIIWICTGIIICLLLYGFILEMIKKN